MPKVVTKHDYKREKDLLKGIGIDAGEVVRITLEGDFVEGLWFPCSPILSDEYLKMVGDAIGESCTAYYLPNLQEIHIRKND